MSGYPALAVGYFDQPGLPRCQCSTPLEYFARAVSWLRAQPAGRGRPVVLYGASDGAQAALLLASYLPHLADAVVASSPTDIIHGAYGGTGPGWTSGGKPLEIGMLIPVTNIRVPLLMGDGGQVLAATLFAHDPAGFDVHVPAGLGGDVLGLGRPGEAGEQALLAGARPPGLGPAW